MAKAYCPECKKMLAQVLSSFECLSTWDKAQDYYAPGNECKLVKRCPDCGTLAKDKERKIKRDLKKKMEMEMEDVKPSHFRRRMKSRIHSV
jgi:hypothetical protein